MIDQDNVLEPFFSSFPCDICHSECAGDRYQVSLRVVGDETSDLYVCTDCLEKIQ